MLRKKKTFASELKTYISASPESGEHNLPLGAHPSCMSVKSKGSGRLYNILRLPVPRAGKVIRYAGSLVLTGSRFFQKRDQEVNSVQAATVTDVALP